MTPIKVIDISEHNTRRGKIDFAKVKQSGVSGVMIRIGWAGYEGGLDVDDNLHDSITSAAAAGLGVGLYVYTYATSTAAAKRAAQEAVAIAQRYLQMITYPIVYDIEEEKISCLTSLGKRVLTETVIAFCDEVQRQRYYAAWYTYTYYATQYLEVSKLAAYDLWAADYRTKDKLDAQIGRGYGMWQYIGDKGTCPGVTGPCDRNYAYRDYPVIIKKAGLNGFGKAAPTPVDTVPRADYDALQSKLAAVTAERDACKSIVQQIKVLADKYK